MADALEFGVDLSDVRDRLIGMGYFLSVTDILEASEALDETLPAAPPAAFVGVSSERAEPNRLASGGHSQRVNVTVAVLFVERAARFDRGAKDRMEQTRKAIIRILQGWKPKGSDRGFNYVGYRVASIGSGLAWGEVTVEAPYRLTVAE